MWGATGCRPVRPSWTVDFNPRSPCGERRKQSTDTSAKKLFQSTLPVWGATLLRSLCMEIFLFQSTLPVWGATLPSVNATFNFSYFNPRSPCGERQGVYCVHDNVSGISIHAPRVGSDLGFVQDIGQHSNFNPRSPCGERHCGRNGQRRDPSISIHAPRVGSDALCGSIGKSSAVFQSTLPVWGATVRAPGNCGHSISIHAPRVGSDGSKSLTRGVPTSISIHAPRVGSDRLHGSSHWQPLISIHAPRVGSDALCLRTILTR